MRPLRNFLRTVIEAMYTHNTGLEQRIRRAFIAMAGVLIVFYGVAIELGIRWTENSHGERTLMAEAPHYIDNFSPDSQGKQSIGPLINMYSSWYALPEMLQQHIPQEFEGLDTVHIDDDEEYTIYAHRQPSGENNTTNLTHWYIVKNMTETELQDSEVLMVELFMALVGITLFFVTMISIRKSLHYLLRPLYQMVEQLKMDHPDNPLPISIKGKGSKEVVLTLEAVNQYRTSLQQSLKREKAFTRYISHELRTPMMVVRACLSLLKKQTQPEVDKQRMRIQQALEDMENLTNVLLLLAREKEIEAPSLDVSAQYVNQQLSEVAHLAEANQCDIQTYIQTDVRLPAHPVLFNVLLKNLLINAINNTHEGLIVLRISQQGLEVTDNGCGLEHDSRGYEGFGVGLLLVEDICQKYSWNFRLSNNQRSPGCHADVVF